MYFFFHDDFIKWKHFPRYCPFVRRIHRSPVNSPHKGQWRGALIFSLIWTWINSWVNNPEVGDLRRHRAHCDVSVMHLWPQKLYRAFRFGTPWLISCSYPRHSQLTRHSLMLANGRIRQSLTAPVIGLQAVDIKFVNMSVVDIMWVYIRVYQISPTSEFLAGPPGLDNPIL